LETEGYVRGSFGVERWNSREWFVTHTPTGMCFLYSSWPTLFDAKLFCEGMLAIDPWEFRGTKRRPANFSEACHRVAAEMGAERRRVYAIG
jgi:hypothetical protein